MAERLGLNQSDGLGASEGRRRGSGLGGADGGSRREPATGGGGGTPVEANFAEFCGNGGLSSDGYVENVSTGKSKETLKLRRVILEVSGGEDGGLAGLDTKMGEAKVWSMVSGQWSVVGSVVRAGVVSRTRSGPRVADPTFRMRPR